MPKKIPRPDGYDFIQLSKIEANPRARVRLLMLARLSEGIDCKGVASLFSFNPMTVRHLLKKYHQIGLAAIYDESGRGRKSLLPKEQFEAATAAILKAQEERGGGRLTGEAIILLLKEQFNVEYQSDSIYRLLPRLGLSWVSGRSAHPKRDAQAQENFKKNL